MNENVIFEGNTIYEIDPLCVREKEQKDKRKGRKRMRWGSPASMEMCRAGKGCCVGVFLYRVVLVKLLM